MSAQVRVSLALLVTYVFGMVVGRFLLGDFLVVFGLAFLVGIAVFALTDRVIEDAKAWRSYLDKRKRGV